MGLYEMVLLIKSVYNIKSVLFSRNPFSLLCGTQKNPFHIPKNPFKVQQLLSGTCLHTYWKTSRYLLSQSSSH